MQKTCRGKAGKCMIRRQIFKAGEKKINPFFSGKKKFTFMEDGQRQRHLKQQKEATSYLNLFF